MGVVAAAESVVGDVDRQTCHSVDRRAVVEVDEPPELRIDLVQADVDHHAFDPTARCRRHVVVAAGDVGDGEPPTGFGNATG